MNRSFDHWAKPYAFIEHSLFGDALERARDRYIGLIPRTPCRILVLGDGDGRFSKRVLEARPTALLDSVDYSHSMLREATSRLTTCERSRYTPIHANAIDHTYPKCAYDVIACHFILDCFVQADADALVATLAQSLSRGGIFIHSDFAIPESGIAKWYSRAVVSSLYLGFRATTRIEAGSLPAIDWPTSLRSRDRSTWLGGMVTSQCFAKS